MGPMGGEWIDLGMGAGATRSGLRRVRVDPGKRATRAHGHAAEEELVYVLGGAGLSWQGGETFEIGAGDFIVHLPRTQAHTLLAGAAGLDALIMGPEVGMEGRLVPGAKVVWIGVTCRTVVVMEKTLGRAGSPPVTCRCPLHQPAAATHR